MIVHAATLGTRSLVAWRKSARGGATYSEGDRAPTSWCHCGSCVAAVAVNPVGCRSGQMIGKHRDGGYAEFIKVPAANVFSLPDESR